MFLDILYEITCLSYKSIIVDKYALAPLNIKYVTSVSHTLFSESVVKFLFNKFNLETTMPKDKRIHIRAKSKNHFKELILPYMHKTMLYKL